MTTVPGVPGAPGLLKYHSVSQSCCLSWDFLTSNQNWSWGDVFWRVLSPSSLYLEHQQVRTAGSLIPPHPQYLSAQSSRELPSGYREQPLPRHPRRGACCPWSCWWRRWPPSTPAPAAARTSAEQTGWVWDEAGGKSEMLRERRRTLSTSWLHCLLTIRKVAVKQATWAWPEGKDFMASKTSSWSSAPAWHWEMLKATFLRIDLCIDVRLWEVISGSCSPLVLGTVDLAPVWSAGGDEVRPGDRGESLDDQVQANIPIKTHPKSE